MEWKGALAGSAVFFGLAPGIVAGVIPWFITKWRFGEGAFLSASIIGGVMTAISLALLIDCFRRFAIEGKGTPAPLAPTEELVISGPYRHVRNPMYLAVTGLIFGQALLFGNAALIAYGVAIWIAFDLFVITHEEPRLRREFSEAYEAYSKAVPRWIPRLTPWKQPEPEPETS